MRAQCRGEYVAQAINCMVQSNVQASRLAMQTPGVHACTDCTGFGLMGHLLEMLVANETQINNTQQELDSIGAVLNISDMEFLKGGLEASSNCIYSSLQPQNERNRRAVINHTDAVKAYPLKYALLFDPQTAGGLIFFVDPTSCDDFVSKLRETYPAAGIIGELVKYPENDSALAGGVCSIGSGASTGQRVRIT
jgi:selenide, water dikinase